MNKNRKNFLTEELLSIYKEYFVDYMMLVTCSSVTDELSDEMINLHNSVLKLEDKLGYILVQELTLYGDLILTKKGDRILIELLPLFVIKETLH